MSMSKEEQDLETLTAAIFRMKQALAILEKMRNEIPFE